MKDTQFYKKYVGSCLTKWTEYFFYIYLYITTISVNYEKLYASSEDELRQE